MRALEGYATSDARPIQQARVAGVHRLAARVRPAMEQAAQLRAEIEALARAHFAPLTTLCGVGPLAAGTLAGLLGSRHFAREEQLASYGGVARLETSSAGQVRHRLNRGGNRRLNAVL